MKRFLMSAATVSAIAVQGMSTASACDRPNVRYYRPYVPAQSAVVVREQHVVTVERAPQITQVVAKVHAPDPQALAVPSGSTLRLAGFFGQERGSVFLTVESLILECKVISWSGSRVAFTLPDLGLLNVTQATIEVARPDGQTAKQQRVYLTAKPELEVVAGPGSEPHPSSEGTAAGQVQTGGLLPAGLQR